MLNFCPDLRTAQEDLRKAPGEFIFLVDRSRSMSSGSIDRVKVPRGMGAPEPYHKGFSVPSLRGDGGNYTPWR